MLDTYDIKWAYVAGLIDGEGTISILYNIHKTPSLRLGITNTDLRVISWLEEWFGGSHYTRKRRNPKHSIAYEWVVPAVNQEEFLRKVVHHLIIKREQALVALQFRAHLSDNPTNFRKLPPDILAERLTMYYRLKELNATGAGG